MSIAQAQEILVLLNEVNAALQNIDTVSTKIQEDAPKLKEAELSLRQDIRMLNLLMITIQRFSGDSTLSGFLNSAQRIMGVVVRINMMFNALAVASGPWGWIYAAANITATGMMMYDAIGGFST